MTPNSLRRSLALPVVMAMLCTSPAFGAGARSAPMPDTNDLAKKTQNPVGDVASVPFQFNFNTGGDYLDADFFNLNFQPVVPIRITPNWNLIARTIVPFLSIPTAGGTEGGIGDIQQQLFFTPAHPGGLIWGIGPIFSLPTATNSLARTGSWAIGPTAVVVKMTGPYVLGGLINNVTTFKDEGGDPEVNQLLIQPFINYNFGTGWALGFGPIITANWELPDGDEWTVPVGLGITRTLVFKGQPISLSGQYYANVVRPPGSAVNQLRFVFSLIYPTGAK